MAIPIVTFIGKSGAGKTTLLEKLVAHLKCQGYRVATIKHHTHSGFDIDVPGKDSWRFAQAGSDQVIIVSPKKIASYRLTDSEPSLDEIAAEVSGVDIILVEGYCQSGKPTVEVLRGEKSKELIGSQEHWIALVTDFPIDINVPQYDLNDVYGIANLVIEKFLTVSPGVHRLDT
jgi:molybdopterin-guanine dinucleotide biosynthesis protein B